MISQSCEQPDQETCIKSLLLEMPVAPPNEGATDNNRVLAN
ncbi:hypothetical protein SAMN05428975_1734 [Mucilaginibacter sp. OK268]|nr:hypothetical protein SAMN05428975_1734 [Mucilaginibacter sp. OK268]